MIGIPLVLLLTLSLEYASCSSGVGDQFERFAIDIPGPHKKISLKLNCVDLFKNHVRDVTAIMANAEMSVPNNYNDLVKNQECALVAGPKCSFVNKKHVAQLMERWTWPEDGPPAPDVATRLQELNSIGCLPEITGWSGVTMDHAANFPLFKELDVKSLKHWPEFDPKILSILLEQGQIFGGMANLSRYTGANIGKIIAHPLFRDGSKMNWLILDSNVISFVADKMPELAVSLAGAFAEVACGLDDSALQAVIAVRMELLLKLILQNEDMEAGDILKIVKLLGESRIQMVSHTTNNAVINILTHVAPETAELFGPSSRYHEDTEDIGVDTESRDRDIADFFKNFGTRCSVEERISFKDYKALLESFDSAPIPIGNLIDFIQLYPFPDDEHIQEDESALISLMLEEAFGDLAAFIKSSPSELELFNPPRNAFRLCSAMLRSRVSSARECAGQINRLFEGEGDLESEEARSIIMMALREFKEFEPVLYAMASTEKELLDLTVLSFAKEKIAMVVDYDKENSKFGIEDFLSKAADKPENFANSYMKITDHAGGKIGTFNDVGGPLRGLLTEVAKYVDTKLMCAKSERDVLTRRPEYGISSKVGIIWGLLLGKGAQQRLRSEFMIDPAFLTLLCDPTAENIAEYFSKTYKDKMAEFKKNFLGYEFMREMRYQENGRKCPTHDDKDCECTYTSPWLEDTSAPKLELVNFHSFTTRSILAKGSINSEDHARLDEALSLEEVEEQYMKPLYSKVLEEFTAFVQEVYKGMSYTLAMDNLKYLSDYHLFERTLNAAEISGAMIIEATEFRNSKDASGNDIMVSSLIPGVEISLVDSFKSIVYAMDGKQKRQLLYQWAGSSSKRLDDSDFKLIFVPNEKELEYGEKFYSAAVAPDMAVEGGQNNEMSEADNAPAMEVEERDAATPDQLDNIPEDESWKVLPPGISVVNSAQEERPDLVLRSGIDYIRFVRKVAKIQSMMLSVPSVDPFAVGTAVDGLFSLVKSTTCALTVYVPKVNSMHMIMGVVYLLNSPTGAYYDENRD